MLRHPSSLSAGGAERPAASPEDRQGSTIATEERAASIHPFPVVPRPAGPAPEGPNGILRRPRALPTEPSPRAVESPSPTVGAPRPRPRRRGMRTAAALGAAVLIVLPMALRGIWGVTASAVLTESMRPAVQAGDLIVTRPIPATELSPGDIAVLDVPGHSILAHRVVEVAVDGETVTVTTQGDANPLPEDPVQIPASATVPVMVARIPALGYVGDLLARRQTLMVGLGLLLVANLFTVLSVLFPPSTVERRFGRKGDDR